MFLLRLIWTQQPSSKRPRWLNQRPSSVERSRANATGDVCPDALPVVRKTYRDPSLDRLWHGTYVVPRSLVKGS